MEYLSNLQLPLATAVIILGAFPEAPAVLQNLARNEWFRWIMVFVLMYQGGGRQDVQLSVIATLVIFALFKVLDMVFPRKETLYV